MSLRRVVILGAMALGSFLLASCGGDADAEVVVYTGRHYDLEAAFTQFAEETENLVNMGNRQDQPPPVPTAKSTKTGGTGAPQAEAKKPRHPPCSACTQCTHGYRVHQSLGHSAKDFPNYVCSIMGCGEKGAHWPDECPMVKDQAAQEQARVLAQRARVSFERENKATTPASRASLAAMVPKKFA